jgi:hypothetical protein
MTREGCGGLELLCQKGGGAIYLSPQAGEVSNGELLQN